MSYIMSTFHDDDFCEARLPMLCTGCLELTTENCRSQCLCNCVEVQAKDIPLLPGFLSSLFSLTRCLAPAPLKLRPCGAIQVCLLLLSLGRLLISLTQALNLQVDKPLKSVIHGQFNTRLTITFLAAGHHRSLTGTKLHSQQALYHVVLYTSICSCTSSFALCSALHHEAVAYGMLPCHPAAAVDMSVMYRLQRHFECRTHALFCANIKQPTCI